MQITAMEDLALNRSGPWYTPLGHVPDDIRSAVKDANILGLGLDGLCIASVIAAEFKRPCSFVRKAPKAHGIPRKIEGAFDPYHPFVVVAEEGTFGRADEKIAALEETISSVFTFPLRGAPATHFTWRPPDMVSATSNADLRSLLRQFLTVQNGDFRLSSGRTSKVFYDTIPACGRIDVAQAVGESLITHPSRFRIGVAHAGCYLAAVAARCAGKTPVFFDPSSSENQGAADFFEVGEPYIVIDDFMTTGKAFESAQHALRDVSTDTHCVAAYSRGDIQRLANSKFEALYECDD